jgi:molecular chaperone DnaK
MSDIAIGIDLGTSNSCVAVLRGGRLDVLPNAYGEAISASVVAIREDGSITVGNAAKANIIHDPKHTIYSSKRLMGRYYFSEEVKKAQAICSYQIVEGPNHSVRIRVRDELFSLPEIGAMVLRELKCVAESRLGQPVTKAVITVPANFNDNQRQATKDAGRIAGLEVLRILNEPTAAALAYGFGKGLNQQVAVYDLGGGTFDISVLEIGRDVFEVLSTCGDTFLGGDDFDDRLIDLLADEFLERHGINLRNDPFALEKLKVAAEGAKKTLSLEDQVEIRIPDVARARDGSASLSVQRTLTSEEFSQLVHDLIQRTFKVCDEAIQQAGIVARDLDGVILVGGPTRLPVIRNAVREYFQQEPRTDVDPDQVVAMGAAIHAATLVDAEREAFLLDVTPLSLRIGVAGGLAESVIERNTPVPIEQTRAFTTFRDDQESVKIRIYQGESRTAEENELLGQFEFAGLRKARRGEVAIDVTFEINADGIVSVTARDRETGKQASTRITLSSGLSEGEIRTIIDEGRTNRVKANVTPGSEVLGSVELVTKPAALVPQTREALEQSGGAPPRRRAGDAPAAPLDDELLADDPDAGQEIELLPDDEAAILHEDEDILGAAPAGEHELVVTTSPAGEHELVVTASPEGEEELVVAATPTDPQLAETRPDELFGPAGSDLSDETGGRRGGDGA